MNANYRKAGHGPCARRGGGFTLIELMITMSVAAILLSVVMPGFRGIIQQQRIATSVNELLNAVYFARSEAVKRRSTVVVCKSADGATCDHSLDWEDGWLVFVNRDLTGEGDVQVQIDGTAPDDEVVFVGEGLAVDITVSPNFAKHLAFEANGSVDINLSDPNDDHATLIFCDDRGADHARAILMSLSGRPQVSGANACS